ncbi:dihydroneopterin aldolase [Candidatus Woesearchaeota archaeon]|nr:dihydroneopterin aldolase [Candidatus Woesearchaeota archaeon]
MVYDKIIIHNALFQVNLGVADKERAIKQEIILDLELTTNLKKAANTDNVHDTINYDEIHALLEEYMKKHQHKLIETFAEKIAQLLLKQYPLIQIRVIFKKPMALAQKQVLYCAVDITRTMVDYS